ncbi:MAG TPA: GGDEF domain-containing protein [Granulicella sp.]
MPLSGKHDIWKGLLRRTLRLGRWGAVLCVTLMSGVMSVALAWVLMHVSPFSEAGSGLMLSLVIPLFIAGPFSWGLLTLLEETEASRNELEELATRDGLTRLFNRRYFMTVLERELSRAVRYAEPLSLLIFDVDDFKLVNDRHGHAAGDQVLEEIARMCAALLRQHDVLARYGGEEFVLLLPRTGEAGAEQVAEKLQAAISALLVDLRRPQKRIGVTVSIGISTLRPEEDGDRMEMLLARADDALYHAKMLGKNRWHVQ